MFLNAPQDDTPYYPAQHPPDLYYSYESDTSYTIGVTNNSVTPQNRPFSASSSSCSSIESGTTDSTHHYAHTNGINSLVAVNTAAVTTATDFGTMSNNCFDPHSPSNNAANSNSSASNWGGGALHHHEFKHEFGHHHHGHGTGYTSVIVDSQQYQMTNEYVH